MKKKSLKRILALFAVVLILGIISAICIMLFNAKHFSNTTVRGLISSLIAFPIVAYGYVILYRFATRYKPQRDAEDDK